MEFANSLGTSFTKAFGKNSSETDALEQAGIELMTGYEPAHLKPAPDLVVVGNALSRGNPAVEYLLNQGIPYISGPQWLAENLLQERWVLAVAGTHGKTSTSSMANQKFGTAMPSWVAPMMP